MGKFSELDLKWWEEEDLEDLDKEFHISEKSIKELEQLSTELYWQAQNLYATVCHLESQSDAIKEYIRLIET